MSEKHFLMVGFHLGSFLLPRQEGLLANLKPHQKFLVGSNSNQLKRPALDGIDLTSVLPQGYDLAADEVWEGEVSFALKGGGERVVFTNGFPDFTKYVYKPPAGSAGQSELWVKCQGQSYLDISLAWADSKFTKVEQAALKGKYTWHHTVDLNNGMVKMQLVPQSVHNAATTGLAHTGGFAVYKWLQQNGIPF